MLLATAIHFASGFIEPDLDLVAAHEGCFWTREWTAVYSFWAEWVIVVWQDRLSV